MALGTIATWRVATRSCHYPFKTAQPALRKLYSTPSTTSGSPTLFTAEIAKLSLRDADALVKRLRELSRTMYIPGWGDDKGHDAAVVLATPGLTRLIDSEAFTAQLASLLSPKEHRNHFHLVSAIVDHVPSVSRRPLADNEGISVLRGPSNLILPHLRDQALSSRGTKKERDAGGALTFGLSGTSSITVPLAQTLFQNGKPSTLRTARFDVSGNAPRLAESHEALSQHVNVPLPPGGNGRQEPHLWLPLIPLTQPRVVAESFGNILRRLEVDGSSAPASSELEAAVDNIYKKTRKELPPDVEGPLFGVWAVVNPTPGQSAAARNWQVEDLENADSKASLAQAIRNGGRTFRLLSGGGGWGSKAGLLSLDPETSPFPASEEEEMFSLLGRGGESDFVPVGSEVQFFCSDLRSPGPQQQKGGNDLSLHRLVFGVLGDMARLGSEGLAADDIVITPNHFGAVSNLAIYMSGGGVSSSKLSVPGSQLGIP